jgi:glutathione S-transferase
LEAAARTRAAGPYLHGATVSLADVCLVPQMYNARRFQCALDAYPTLVAVDAALRELPAFAAAVPERQADAE